MTSKAVRVRFPWLPALFVFAWIPLGAIPSFSEPIALSDSGIFSLTNLRPITVNDLDVTPTPATASFNVVNAGYFVVSSTLSLTSGSGNAGPKFDTPLTPLSGFGLAPPSGGSNPTSTGNSPVTDWTAPSTGFSPQSQGSGPATGGLTTFAPTSGPSAPVPLPVPEPSTVLLVGLGLAVIGMRNYAVHPR